MNKKQILFIVCCTTVFWPFLSSAHKLNLFVWTENNTVTVESSLSGGRTLVHAAVSVVDANSGKTIISGETDTNGIFSFSLPEEIIEKSLPLDIIVNGGDGHRAHWLLKGDEYGGGAETAAPLLQAENKPAVRQTDKGECSCLTKGEFEELLDTHLERKLAVIRKNVGHLANPSPSLRDIGAGIGYLLGCAGLIAWFQSRKQMLNNQKGER